MSCTHFLFEELVLFMGVLIHLLKYLLTALSAEEERLWNIVTTNSLEFDAWTALIDETERTSDVCMIGSTLLFLLFR